MDEKNEYQYCATNLQTVTRSWFSDSVRSFACPIFGTLTYAGYAKGKFWSDNKRDISIHIVKKHFKRFYQDISRLAYGKANKRFGKSLKMIPIIEGYTPDDYHMHMIFDKPEKMLIEPFMKLISKGGRFKKELWHHGISEVQIAEDSQKVTDYVTKLETKPDYIDGILFEFVNLKL